jgi:predicted dehydrogenase
MKKQLRAGIVGAGFMAGVHARAIRDCGNDVVGIASSSLESAQQAASQLNIPNSYGSWKDLVASPEVEVVHICTPNEFHAEIILAATKNNKDIVCEKPISITFEEALEIQSAVSQSKSGFAVPFAYRFYPVVREMRARVQRGDAGRVHLMHGSYLQDWLADSNSSNWRVDSASGGASRAFADIGIHWCDLMEFVSGDRIVKLIANTAKAYDSRSGKAVATEDISNIIFETKRGATGSLTVSQVSHGRKNRLWLELDGSKASFSFNQENPDSFWIGGQSSNQIVMHGNETMESNDSKRLSNLPSGHPNGYQDAFNFFMADAYAGFQGNEVEGTPGLVDGVRSAALVQAVLESATESKWVEVKDVAGVPRVAKIAS